MPDVHLHDERQRDHPSLRCDELDELDELRMFRNPFVVGGGTPFLLPPVTKHVRLDLV